MRISKETTAILKNFASINSNLMLKEGNKLSTISVGKSLVGTAVIAESIPQDFGIYDIQEFLGVLSLFEEPEIIFDGKYLTVEQGTGKGKSSIKYYGADESVLVYPKKSPALTEAEITFTLKAEHITSILRTASVLKTSDVRFVGDGTSLSVVVGEKKNNTANSFVLVIDETDKEFSVSINIDNLKVIPQDFTVGVIGRRMLRLHSESLTYIIAIETDSSFPAA